MIEVSTGCNAETEHAIENAAEGRNEEVVIMEELPSIEDSSSSEEIKDAQITDDDVSKHSSVWEIEDEDAPTGITFITWSHS